MQQCSGATMPGANQLSCVYRLHCSFYRTRHAPIPLDTPLSPPPPAWDIPPSRLRDMVYRLLEDRSKKGAGRSMRALAWRVCAWVLPLYRNLEPITRKPLGGGSGDTSLQGRDGGKERGSDAQRQAQGWTTAGLPSRCPTTYDNSKWSRR